jgi:hypothetical protein
VISLSRQGISVILRVLRDSVVNLSTPGNRGITTCDGDFASYGVQVIW